MIATTVLAEDSAGPYLGELIRLLGAGREFHERWGERSEQLTRAYLAREAVERHDTADSLGARPTGILSRAAESPESSATETMAVLTMRPGEVLARAFRDVEITPRAGRKYLTIPVRRESYGKRAGEFDDLFFLRDPDLNGNAYLAKRAKNGDLMIYYLLVPRVLQKQDRTLLPSDEAYFQMGEEAAADLLLEADDAARKKGGRR